MTIAVKSNKWPYQVKEPIDSGALLNYGIDWSDWLPTGVTIQTATWAVTGGIEHYKAIVDAVTYVWLSASDGSTEIQATVHITLDTSPVALKDERTLILNVRER